MALRKQSLFTDKSWRAAGKLCKLRRVFAYALTIFLGAFLLFQVQPLIGKFILPWFGGGPGVWTTCLLFFQVVLLGGYAYAHFSSRWLKLRSQVILHGVLLAVSLPLLPIAPGDSWKPAAAGNPVVQILLLLTACLGLPYLVLSATGPLVQQWFSRANPGVSPYRLYALSNFGSLLALVSYPVFVETQFTRRTQAALWAVGFGAYAICCAWCALKLWRLNPVENIFPDRRAKSSTLNSPPSTLNKLLWLLLPACATALLLATTNKLSQDIAAMPFLWVLPLALYLLSFIICFDHSRWYVRGLFTVALVAAAAGVCWALFLETDVSLRGQVAIYAGALFVCCMVCHGELFRLRPDPRQLTGFYLMIAAGGALGGAWVAVIAPLIFEGYYEMHWALLLCGLLFIAICLREKSSSSTAQWRWLALVLTLAVFVGMDQSLVWLARHYPEVVSGQLVLMRVLWWGALVIMAGLWLIRQQHQTFTHYRLVVCFWLVLGWIALATGLWFQTHDFGEKIVQRSRNFYGSMRVCEYRKDEPESHYFLLEHGRITHGLQFADPRFAKWATTYYGGSNGLALGIAALPAGPRRLGVVGLGTGTTAAYGRTGDALRIYEINPDVLRLASSRFTYLSNCAAKLEFALGDARLSLEREPPQNFDLLALDAFSSDAIPVHLLTKEAFELYGRHVKTNGVIAVHISNRYLNLEPVIRNAAAALDYKIAVIEFEEDDSEDEEAAWWIYSSTWVLLTHNEAIINSEAITNAMSKVKTNAVKIPLWTDDFASIFQILE
ncbi:MAG: ferrichrome ABC transporter permease [Pedosphaera sp.]|nr:ferrichrome ABC transporter permease [Pedosphaera sp.]